MKKLERKTSRAAKLRKQQKGRLFNRLKADKEQPQAARGTSFFANLKDKSKQESPKLPVDVTFEQLRQAIVGESEKEAVSQIKEAAAAGFPLDHKDKDGHTLTYHALLFGKEKCCEAILELTLLSLMTDRARTLIENENINKLKEDEEEDRQWDAMTEPLDKEDVKELLTAMNEEEGMSADEEELAIVVYKKLQEFIEDDHDPDAHKIVRKAIKAGFPVDFTDSREFWGQTLLHQAAYSGDDKTCDVLLKLGADINKRDRDDQTPVFQACMNGCIDCAKILIASGADLNITADDGKGPLEILEAKYGKEARAELELFITRLELPKDVLEKQFQQGVISEGDWKLLNIKNDKQQTKDFGPEI
ncbi:MAG: ankyrin repeat domain-containing protein [Synergistaceae bacterium]|nr:ankyrin repeat domain-containing protein [Synergistaceae bacterium]